jgi:predicted nucleotidyltransferase
MNSADVIGRLRERLGEMEARFGVVRLRLFGSIARGEASDASDIDILVGFDGPATYDRYFGLKFFLEDLFGRNIDLVTETALRADLRDAVLGEAIPVA